MSNFFKSLFLQTFSRTKGNGIVRQVKRAEHKVALKKVSKAVEYAGSTAFVAGGTAALAPLWNGSISGAIGGGAAITTYNSFFKKDALKSIKEAIKQCKALKASEEYQAIVDRAKRIKSSN